MMQIILKRNMDLVQCSKPVLHNISHVILLSMFHAQVPVR